MTETYYINGVPFEVDVNEVEDFLANNPTATKTPPESKVDFNPLISNPISTEETSFSLMKDIETVQDGRLADIRDFNYQTSIIDEDKKEQYEQFKQNYGTNNVSEVYSEMYGDELWTEKQYTGSKVYPLPNNPEGFLIGNDNFFQDTGEREEHREYHLNKLAGKEKTILEEKYNYDEDLVTQAIIDQGDLYIDFEESKIAKLRREGKKDEADALAKKLGYVKLTNEEGDIISGWLPEKAALKAEDEATSKDIEVLEQQRENAYFRLLSMIKMADRNNNDYTSPHLATMYKVTGANFMKDIFSDEGYSDVLDVISQISKTGELLPGLANLPEHGAIARDFNKALLDFTTMNLAIEINADLSKKEEGNFFVEMYDKTNDDIVESFTGQLELNGYIADPKAIQRPGSDWNWYEGHEGPANILGEEIELRDALEGVRDMTQHLIPLVASVVLFKKSPASIGKFDKAKNVFQTKSFEQVLNSKVNTATKFIKRLGPESRVYKNTVDLLAGSFKEVAVLGGADVPLTGVFGQDPFVYNRKTGDINLTFPAALGFGNTVAQKVLGKLNSTKNFFTPALAQIERSKAASALFQGNIAASTGTATLYFAESVNSKVVDWKNLGYESEEEYKQETGLQFLGETYLSMFALSTIHPSARQNMLSKLGKGMYYDISRAATGLTPRQRAAKNNLGVERNKDGDFSLKEIEKAKKKKIKEISKDKKLDAGEKRLEAKKVEHQAEQLIYFNELKLAKQTAKKHGVYMQTLTNTFTPIKTKLQSGKEPNAKEVLQFNNLSEIEFNYLKAKFKATKGTQLAKLLDNKRAVYKEIVDIVDGQQINNVDPLAREKHIDLYLKQAVINGKIDALVAESVAKPATEAKNVEKIKELKLQKEKLGKEILKNEKVYDKLLKNKFKIEVEFAKTIAAELNVGFKVQSEAAYIKAGGKKGSDGRFVTQPGKRDMIFINKDQALKARQLGVPLHEITHKILKNFLRETYTDANGDKRSRVSDKGMMLIDQFRSKLTGKELKLVEERIESEYKFVTQINEATGKKEFVLDAEGKKIEVDKREYYDEYLTVFGDLLKNKKIPETTGLANRVKDVVYPLMQRAGFENLRKINAESGQGLLNMIKAIQKMSETGVIDKAILNVVKKSKKPSTKDYSESQSVTKEMKQASENIDRIYKEKGLEGYNEIIEAIKGKDAKGKKVGKDFIKMYTKIYEGHENYRKDSRLGYDKNLYDAMANDPVYGVLGSIVKYDASKGTTMAEHILGRLKKGKHIDVSNLILGKGAAREFTKKLDAPDVLQVEAQQKTAEELLDEKMAREAEAELPNFRKSLKVKGETGISKELVETIKESTTNSFLFTKTEPKLAKKFKQEITENFAEQLKVPMAKMMGGGPTYETFLRENYESIVKKGFIDTKFFVDIESVTPRKDRVFTEVEIENMSVKETDKAIKEERVPRTTSRTAGNTLWKFKDPGLEAFVKFYTPPAVNPATGKRSGLKGTRKDKLAEQIGIKLASDMASTVLRIPEVMAKLKGVKSLEISKEIEGVEKELGKDVVLAQTRAEVVKIAEAKNEAFDNYIIEVAEILRVNPDAQFSTSAEFKREVKELQSKLFKASEISEIFNVNTGKVLINKEDGNRFTERAAAEVFEAWKNQKLDIKVSYFRDVLQKELGKKLTKGTGYEKYTETNIKEQAKKVKGVKVISEITEKSIELEAIGDFPGGKVQAPDFIVEYNGAKQIWELKYKEARTPKNSAGFINYSQALRDIKAGKEFKLTDRKKTRKNAAEEAIFVESVKEAIENGAAKVEAILREYKVLKPGQDFTSKTKIPLEVHNIINGKEKASLASSSKIVDGNWVAADYNAKGVHHFQMATKGAFFMGSDPHGMLREAGGTKLEGNFPLMTRVYSSSYKQIIGGKEVTAGYTYKLVGEALINPKNITSVSKISLDAAGAIKKMANTKAAKQAAIEAKAAKKALAQNNKNVPKILESKTNSELKRKAKTFDKALMLGRQRNKTARGMSTFDFDETLIDGGQNFVTAINPVNGRKVKISSSKWPIEGPKFEAQGFTFDFKDFVNVRGGKEGPLLQKMRNQIKKYGPENVFVLTARMQESAPAINGWLKSKGINIPFENITGLGNSKGEAKAMWMLEKFSEGYNDMYFVDDALPNVKAVKEVLSQLDIKSNVQQVYSRSRDINREVNDIMQHSLDIASNKTFSKAEAKVRGKDIKRRRIFMRDSAADLELLIEPLYGKGTKGNENKKWFKEELVLPFERGIRDYNTARQSAKNDYMALRKQNKDVVKIISKEVEGTSFTNDMAMRVYLWNKAGFKIPDLAKGTEAKLVEHVKNNPSLQRYAEKFAQITKQEKGLKEPGENWWAETMAGEVTNIDRGVSRKQYLQEWIDRKNEIFTEQNLNKMESKLGTRWRENITDMFDRMETGRTRSLKMDRGSAAMMNYLNGGIGTIMNFNTRSAALQTISTLNFINMRENNPISAALAMGNVKQFSKDFMFIMNSDMLKQRRDGLSINVTEAEIASAAASSPNMIQGIISKVLKVGYTPTKLADSFAISFGGATFYRNRIKMYEKQGMETKAAEKQAFLDFQVLSERTQQSSRADLLSKQQTSLIGRFILPFANTPMQMNRAGMKDILDLAKGRTKGLRNQSEAMGRIAYYMGAQVSIFAGLQSALFAMLLNDEDITDEKIASTKTYTLQSTSDSMLRGFGVQGAFISAFKNASLEFFKQNPKGFMADYGEVTEDLLNISPPIGSKIGMLDAAGDRLKFNTKTPFKFELGNPKLEAGLMSIQAITNAPVYSPYQNITNMQHALSDQYETWQRVLMGAGWTPYNVGIEQEKKKKKKRSKTKNFAVNPYTNK